MRTVRVGPKRFNDWPGDMKRVRDSAFNHSRLTLVERLSRRHRYGAEAARYPQLLTRLECWVVRAEIDGTLVGYAWGYEVDDRLSWVYIDDVAVHVDHQGQGVGTALVKEIAAWLRECGIRHISGFPTDRRMAVIFHREDISAAPPRGE